LEHGLVCIRNCNRGLSFRAGERHGRNCLRSCSAREDNHLTGSHSACNFQGGKKWNTFFNQQGRLLHVSDDFYEEGQHPLRECLEYKYEWSDDDASNFSSFLTRCLRSTRPIDRLLHSLYSTSGCSCSR
ncbi:hypothetical protein PENTCL1PPCAC_30308, partial [Pristionchus entomophagus]